MKSLYPLLVASFLALPAQAEEIFSVYTDIDTEKTCVTVAKAPDGDGDWATLVCSGYMGFPVVIGYGDARETVYYGFSPSPDRLWESFDGFNSSGKKVEWRIMREAGKTVPYATINRWSVADPEDPDKQIEVLVVSKVGQLDKRQGCVIGMVRASGNPEANVMARKIADEQTGDFSCGDERTLVGEPMPSFQRTTE